MPFQDFAMRERFAIDTPLGKAQDAYEALDRQLGAVGLRVEQAQARQHETDEWLRAQRYPEADITEFSRHLALAKLLAQTIEADRAKMRLLDKDFNAARIWLKEQHDRLAVLREQLHSHRTISDDKPRIADEIAALCGVRPEFTMPTWR